MGSGIEGSCLPEPKQLQTAYAAVERLLLNADRNRIMLAHALVALGKPLRCSMPRCARGDAGRGDFEPTGPLRLSVDHVQRLEDGGSHRPDNLRFAHIGCNVAAQHQARLSKSPERAYTPPDAFDQLSALQQEMIEEQHGPQPDDSRWRFESGQAMRV